MSNHSTDDSAYHFYATWPFGWGVGETKEQAFKNMLHSNPQAAEKHEDGKWYWTRKYLLNKEGHAEVLNYSILKVPGPSTRPYKIRNCLPEVEGLEVIENNANFLHEG